MPILWYNHPMEIREFFPIWNKLEPIHQALLREQADLRQVPAGTLLHGAKADCTGLILIVSGQLRAYILSEEGREITLYRLFERDLCLFSASCMIRSLNYDIMIEAEKECEFYLIPSQIYKQIADVSAPLAGFTGEVMADRFSEVIWLIEQILWKNMDQRIAAFLINESLINETEQLKITHEAIAHHLGTHREVVTRMLRYFQGEGLIQLSRGRVKIADKPRLEALAE